MSVNVKTSVTNLQRAAAAWGEDMPAWVRLLAGACDAANQRSVGDRLGKSSGYVSRVLNNNYPGDMAEAERLVRAAYGAEDVWCPIWSAAVPLKSCMHLRRRSTSAPPQNMLHQRCARYCPNCANNTDRDDGE